MIEIRSAEEIEKIRAAGRIVKKTLDVLLKHLKAGVTTLELDKIAENEILSSGGSAAFKGYRGYPNTICASVNESIVHEIPSDKRVLKAGDIVGFDVGVGYKGYFADAAYTAAVGRISGEAEKLISVTKEALYRGIAQAIEGKRVYDISHAVQSHVESNGFNVVKAFVGHGIGRSIHEEPEIPNYGEPNTGKRLKEGMILAIEPMVTAGSFDVKVLPDGWTAVTRDKSLSAHFEHTVAVGKDRADILT